MAQFGGQREWDRWTYVSSPSSLEALDIVIIIWRDSLAYLWMHLGHKQRGSRCCCCVSNANCALKT